jgi:hypothetical protein
MRNRDAPKQSVSLVKISSREVQRVGWTGGPAVAEGEAPQAINPDWQALIVLQHADEDVVG